MTELERLQDEVRVLKARITDLETDNKKSLRQLSSFFKEEEKEMYIIIAQYSTYTLMYRGTQFEPWIVAYHCRPEQKCWDQGHYFDKFATAIRYLFENEPVLVAFSES